MPQIGLAVNTPVPQTMNSSTASVSPASVAHSSSPIRTEAAIYSTTQCEIYGSSIQSQYYWTPIILLNSPYGGSASGTSTASVSSSYSFSGITSTTGSVSSVSISASNGGAEGYFELDQWSLYNAHNVQVTSSETVSHTCNSNYVAEITDKTGQYWTGTILKANTESDINEPSVIQNPNDGINTINFYNGYNPNTMWENSADFSWDAGGSGATGSSSWTVTQYTIVSISTSVSFPIATVAGDLTMSASIVWWDFWNTNSYTYSIPNDMTGTYYFEALASGTGHNVGYAFNYVP